MKTESGASQGAAREFRSEGVAGFLHAPTGPGTGDGFVLTHGAGGNCQSPLLVTVANAFAAAGCTVLRVNLAFRQRRPFGPPLPATSPADRAGLVAAVAALKQMVSGRVCLGGHSYGGRQATIITADEPSLVAGLLLLSYPLHPPDKPEQLRTDHFPRLRTPALFVHGTSDPFGSVDEMNKALAIIPGAHALVMVNGAGHDLSGGKFDAATLVVGGFSDLLRR